MGNEPVVNEAGGGFVRDATAADASAVAGVQMRCWRNDYPWPDEVFTELAASDPELQWARAVIAPPGPGHRLLVATHGGDVVGFGALAPSADADAEPGEVEIVAWEVDPEHRGHGHGSRLLAALADHARSIRANTLVAWISPEDESRRFVLREAGFQPDGAHRAVRLGDGWGTADVELRQVRLVAALD